MDYFYNQNKNHGYYDQPTHNTGHALATASMILGVCALASCVTIYLSIFLGCLGLLFAFLSKGFDRKMLGSAKAGSICSVCGILFSLAIIVALILFILHDPSVLLDVGREYDQLFQERYGQSALSIFGYSYEELANRVIALFS